MLRTLLLVTIGLVAVNCQLCPSPNCNNHGTCSQGHCICFDDYNGNDCSIHLSTLQPSVQVTDNVTPWSWRYYVVTNSQLGTTIRVAMHPQNPLVTTEDCDIYIKRGELPTSVHYDAANIVWGSESTLLIENAANDRFYIGIYANFMACSFSLLVTIETPSGSCPEGCVHGQCAAGTCICDPGFKGPSCTETTTVIPLPMNTWQTGSVEAGFWTYYNIDLAQDYSKMEVSMNVTSLPILDHDCDVYIRRGELPTLILWDYQDASIVSSVTVNIPNAVKGTWYVGIWGFRQCNYRIKSSAFNDVCISQCSAHGTCVPPCQCSSGYEGSYCQNKTLPLATDESVTGYVDKNTWNYYSYWVGGSQMNVVINVVQKDEGLMGDADLYIKLDSIPTRLQYDYLEISASNNATLVIPDIVYRMIYIGVFGWKEVGYTMKIGLSTSCQNACIHGNCTLTGICECAPSWSGPACDTQLNILTSGQPVSGVMNSTGEWHYYRFTSTAPTVVVSLKEEGIQGSMTGLLYLLISEAFEPTLRDFNYIDIDLNKGFHTIQLNLENRVGETISWVVGVYGSPYVVNPVPFKLVMWQPIV